MKGLNNRVNSNGLKLKMQVMNISIHMCEYIKTRIYMDIEEKTDQNCWDNEGFVLKALLHRRVLGGVIIITTYQSNFILWKFDNRLINCFLASLTFPVKFLANVEPWPGIQLPTCWFGFWGITFLLIWSDRFLGWRWRCLHFYFLCQVGLQTK